MNQQHPVAGARIVKAEEPDGKGGWKPCPTITIDGRKHFMLPALPMPRPTWVERMYRR